MSDQPVFRRFPPDRQEQIRQLLTYVQLLGLSGQDLVSIGQTMTRMAVAPEIERHRSIARTMVRRIKTVPGYNSAYVFEWLGDNGRVYVFSRTAMKHTRVFIDTYDTTKSMKFARRDQLMVAYLSGYSGRTWMHNVLLNIHYGNIVLS